jgi:hypothetical protein
MKKLIPWLVLVILLTGCAPTENTNNKVTNDTASPGGIVQRSFTMNQSLFDRAYDDTKNVSPTNQVVAGIIPHHLLASHLIARWFEGIKQLNPSVVVVIGPNHNEIGYGPILISNLDWTTPYGILPKQTDLVTKLVDSKLVTIDERIFTQEHSISAEVSFIKRTFPNTKFVPIILNNRVSDADLIKLAEKLNEILPPDALVIASVDFAHYVTSSEADRQDGITLEALKSLDLARVGEMFVDSKPTIRAVLAYAKLRQATELVVQENSNVAKVTGQPEIPEVTSYFTAYYCK